MKGEAINYCVKHNIKFDRIKVLLYENNLEYKFTENTLQRFYATQIQCFCGDFIDKQQIPCTYDKDREGNILREWKCPHCKGGSYVENVSKLIELGLLK